MHKASVQLQHLLVKIWFFDIIDALYGPSRGVYSGHRIDYGLAVSGRFEMGLWVLIVFYIIVNHFLSPVKLNSIAIVSGLF